MICECLAGLSVDIRWCVLMTFTAVRARVKLNVSVDLDVDLDFCVT